MEDPHKNSALYRKHLTMYFHNVVPIDQSHPAITGAWGRLSAGDEKTSSRTFPPIHHLVLPELGANATTLASKANTRNRFFHTSQAGCFQGSHQNEIHGGMWLLMSPQPSPQKGIERAYT